MKEIVIKKLSSELNKDYLDFFDNRAFTDNNPNGPCYCTSPNQDEESIKQMVSEFQENGIKETVRKYAVKMLDAGEISGYLAFEIAPEYRGKGLATAFIERVCSDAKASGYAAVEGYAKISETRDEYDFTGPIHLYEKAGFVQVMECNGQIVMRKVL